MVGPLFKESLDLPFWKLSSSFHLSFCGKCGQMAAIENFGGNRLSGPVSVGFRLEYNTENGIVVLVDYLRRPG